MNDLEFLKIIKIHVISQRWKTIFVLYYFEEKLANASISLAKLIKLCTWYIKFRLCPISWVLNLNYIIIHNKFNGT